MPNQGFTNKQLEELASVISSQINLVVPKIIDIKLAPIQKELAKLKPMQTDIRKIKADQKLFLNHLDRRIIDIDKRVDKLEGKPVFN